MDQARLMAMIGGVQEEPRITTLREARVRQLLEVVERTRVAFQIHQIVTLTRDSGASPCFVGEPHVVLARSECSPGMPQGTIDPHYLVVTIDGEGDIVAAWVRPHQIEEYVPGERED